MKQDESGVHLLLRSERRKENQKNKKLGKTYETGKNVQEQTMKGILTGLCLIAGLLLTANTASAAPKNDIAHTKGEKQMKMDIRVGNARFTATFADNSSVEAFKKLLAKPLTLTMHDYANMEKSADLGTALPENNRHLDVKAGDIVLYQGKTLVIYYDDNSWNLTPIAKIDNVSAQKLRETLGKGDVTAALSLKTAENAAASKGANLVKAKELQLTDEWDKTFQKSEKVNHKKVTFVNRYGITLAADMYEPKNIKGKLPALAVSGPFGAVKEQASGLYAQTMAERGFLTLAFDPSYTGESGGESRNVASPDINTEDFMAAVDFLSVQENVDPDQIGIIGICGFGGMALNAAALDTRIKATVTSTMYDMTRVTANGYFDNENNEEARYEKRKAMSLQRTEDYKNGVYASAGALPDIAPENAPQFLIDYIGYYRNRERGFHPRSQGEGLGWNATGCESFLNMPILQYSSEIRSAVLIIHGEKAHSCYFSKDAYADMTKNSPYKNNKELLLIPDAVHTDLYDRTDIIPFDTIEAFFRKNLTQK